MNDDFIDDGDFDDFSDDFDDDGDSFEDYSDDGFETDDSFSDEIQGDSGHEDDGIDIGWEDIAIIGGMAEEFAEEEMERRKLEKKMEADRDKRNNQS